MAGVIVPCTGEAMSLYRPEWGFDGTTLNLSLKRKFRWLFSIQSITTGLYGSDPLPCVKASRPKLQFREMQAEHLNETISYPSKPDWQPIQLSIYDRCIASENPIMTWLKQQYDPTPNGCSAWYPCQDPLAYKTCAILALLDGCGNIIEQWLIEHCWASSVDFGELDMTSSEVVTAEVTLKYDRAYQISPAQQHVLYGADQTVCTTCQDPVCPVGSSSNYGNIPNTGPNTNPSGGTSGGGGGGGGSNSNSNGSQNSPSPPGPTPGPSNGPANGFAPPLNFRTVTPDFSMI